MNSGPPDFKSSTRSNPLGMLPLIDPTSISMNCENYCSWGSATAEPYNN